MDPNGRSGPGDRRALLSRIQKHGTATQRRVTELLISLRDGDRRAFDELVPLVYNELRHLLAEALGRAGLPQGIARSKLRLERSGHTLNTTALVNEAYLKLVQVDRVHWQSRAHFLAIAAQAMRNILVSHARHRKRVKRGGGAALVSLSEAAIPGGVPTIGFHVKRRDPLPQHPPTR